MYELHIFRIFVINTAPSYDEMMTIYKKLAQKIWYKIPSQMKNRPCWMYWGFRDHKAFDPTLCFSIIAS